MNSAMYDSSFLTKRLRDKAISESFLNRIQRASNPTTGSAPLLGISQQSIINHVTEGQMSQFRKSEGGCTVVSPGCPCGPLSLATTASSIPCVLDAFWATSLTGGASDIFVSDVIVGACGNVYVIGQSFGAMNVNGFGSPPSPIGAGNLINTPTYAIIDANEATSQFTFVIKYDTYGAVQWATKIDVPTGGATGSVSGNSIVIDSNENVYVLGTASVDNTSTAVIYHATPPPSVGGTITFNTYAEMPLVAANVATTFVVKFDTNGQAEWATYLTSSTNVGSSNGGGLAVDSSGNVFLSGSYQSGPITLNSYGSISGSPATVNITTPSITLPAPMEDTSSFVAKFLPNGELDWATYSVITPQPPNTGGSGIVLYNAIAVDGNGDAHITGFYGGGFTDDRLHFYNYNGGVSQLYGYLTANSNTVNNLLVVKYTGSGISKGNVAWATFVASLSSTDETGSGIAVDSNSNVYVIGTYNSIFQTLYDFVSGGTGNLIVTNGLNTITSPTTTATVLIVKYNSAGTVLAATNMTGTNQNIGNAIAVDGNANVYVTGYYFSSALTLNSFFALGTPITMTTYGTLPLGNVGLIDAFVVKLNSSLVVQWGVRVDAGPSNALGNSIAVDPNGNVHAVGIYGADVNVYGFGAQGTPITFNPYGYLAFSGITNSYLIKYRTNGTLV